MKTLSEMLLGSDLKKAIAAEYVALQKLQGREVLILDERGWVVVSDGEA